MYVHFNVQLFFFTIFLLIAQMTAASGYGMDLTYWYRNYDNPRTFELLNLVLKKTTDFYGDYKIVRTPKMTQGRAIVELQDGRESLVRVINAVSDIERELQLRPIRFAAEEGLIGWRVCVIKRQDQPLFEGVKSHKDILERNIVFGQGTHWPDTKILESNRLRVVTSVHFESLIPMLKAGRFNCFLRGIGEVLEDLRKYPDEQLMIEKSLLFSYPSTSLFLLEKEDVELASRLELGLRRSHLDGSLEKFFKHHYQQVLVDLNVAERRVIRLNNPYISDSTLNRIAEKHAVQDGRIDLY